MFKIFLISVSIYSSGVETDQDHEDAVLEEGGQTLDGALEDDDRLDVAAIPERIVDGRLADGDRVA